MQNFVNFFAINVWLHIFLAGHALFVFFVVLVKAFFAKQFVTFNTLNGLNGEFWADAALKVPRKHWVVGIQYAKLGLNLHGA